MILIIRGFVRGSLLMQARRLLPAILVTVGLTVISGCEPRSVNHSPSPDQDPERYARALEDDRRAIAEAKEAEARFFRNLRNRPEGIDESEAIAFSEFDRITP